MKYNTCSEEYVGETLRAVSIRCEEHSDAIRLGHGSKSAIAEHVHNQSLLHEMDRSSLCVIDQASKKKERKIREAFHIYKRKPRLNKRPGCRAKSSLERSSERVNQFRVGFDMSAM